MVEPPSLVGRTIARRYYIEELVGGGAMGDVYRARHVGLGTDVAVKIMRPSIADDANFKERFYREAKAASRLEHPNSVRVIDFGEEDDGLVYLAMEFLRGRDLLTILRDEWPLPDERIVDILTQTLAAISMAHGHGIVHRDLKPENIMIVRAEDDDHRDGVKVCDFGIAKLTDARAFKSHEDVKTALTTGNAIIGTPEYMSPEQARGERLDARSDLYSLGVILYRMLAGRLPFDAENAIGIAVKHVMEEPVPPSRLVEHVNPRLEAICLRALRKDPAERQASAKEMRAELRAAVLGGTPPRRISTAPVASASERALIPLEGAATVSVGFAPRPSSDREVMVPVADRTDVLVPLESNRHVVGAIVGIGALALAAVVFVWSRPEHASDPGAALVSPALETIPSASHLPTTPTSASPENDPASPGAPTRSAPRIAARSTTPPSTSAAPLAHSASAAPAESAQDKPSPPSPSPALSASTADYKPSNALVAFQPLTTERVQREVLERKLTELAPRLNDCYRDALFIVGGPVGGRADIHMSIDPSGRVVSVVIAPQLPPFQRCASRLVSSLSLPPTAVESGGGTAEQPLKLNP